MKIYVKKSFLRTDGRTTQNYSSEPHKIKKLIFFSDIGRFIYQNLQNKILRNFQSEC